LARGYLVQIDHHPQVLPRQAEWAGAARLSGPDRLGRRADLPECIVRKGDRLSVQK